MKILDDLWYGNVSPFEQCSQDNKRLKELLSLMARNRGKLGETLKLIAEGKLDTEPLITHTYPLAKIDEAYELFENKRDGVIKIAVEC